MQKLKYPYYAALKQQVLELQETPHRILHLELEAFSQFSCSVCGDCCKLPWNIYLSKEYYETWYPRLDQHASGLYKQPFSLMDNPKSSNHYASVRRDPDTGFCIFLEDDNHCFLHREYGEAALASPCKTFPRAYKELGQHYQAYYVLNSCLDVPALLQNYPDLCAEIRDSKIPYFIQREKGEHFGRYENYLWLGLAYDVLEADFPTSVLARWRTLIPLFEAIEARGIHNLKMVDMDRLYADSLSQLKHSSLFIPQQKQLQRALQWSVNILRYHPGCAQWLRELLKGQQKIPYLNEQEARLLDRHLYLYKRQRLLAMPYNDAFLGELSFWQQVFTLSLQVLAYQWLAMYYRFRAAEKLNEHHLQRAMSTVGKLYEQREDLKTEAAIDRFKPHQCFEGLNILMNFDFAAQIPYQRLVT